MTPPSITGDPCEDLEWEIRGVRELIAGMGCDGKPAALEAARQALAEAEQAREDARKALEAFETEASAVCEAIEATLAEARAAAEAAQAEADALLQALIDAIDARGATRHWEDALESIEVVPGLWVSITGPTGDELEEHGSMDAWRAHVRSLWLRFLNDARGTRLALSRYLEAVEILDRANEGIARAEGQKAAREAAHAALLETLESAEREIEEAAQRVADCEEELRLCEEYNTWLAEKAAERERCLRRQPVTEARQALREGLNELYPSIREIEEKLSGDGEGPAPEDAQFAGEANQRQRARHAQDTAHAAGREAVKAFDEALALQREAGRLIQEGRYDEAQVKLKEAEAKRAEAERQAERTRWACAQVAFFLQEAERVRQEILEGIERQAAAQRARWAKAIRPVVPLPEKRKLSDPDSQIKSGAKIVLERALKQNLATLTDCELKAIRASQFSNAAISDSLFAILLDVMTAPLQVAAGSSNVLQLGVSLGRSLLGAVATGESFSESAAADLFAFVGGSLFPKLVGDELGDVVNDLAQGGLEAIAQHEGVHQTAWSGEYEGCAVTTTVLANPHTGWAVLLIKVEGCPPVAIRYRFGDSGTIGNDARVSVRTLR